MNRPIPRLTRWAMWHLPSDNAADAIVVLTCCILLVMVVTGVIR